MLIIPLFVLLVVLLSACVDSSQKQVSNTSSTDYPEQNVTWLTPFTVGGATDIFSRQVGRLLNSSGISDASFVYENHGGGGGQVGLGMAIEQRKGDDYTLIPLSSTYTILPNIQGQKYSYKDLTIVCKLCSDFNIIYVNSKSGYDSMEDLIKAGKEKQLVLATSGVGGTSEIIANMIAAETGIQFRAVPYNGSGELNTALLGNQVDFSLNNPNEILEFIKSGELKALAVTSSERLAEFPDIPTLTELGINIVHETSRGIAMPPGVSDEARQYWIEKCRELAESEEFRKGYLESFVLSPSFKAGNEYMVELDAEFDISKDILTKLGLAK
jgi:putative tricarboxylic transport membrane protein